MTVQISRVREVVGQAHPGPCLLFTCLSTPWGINRSAVLGQIYSVQPRACGDKQIQISEPRTVLLTCV